VGNPARQIGWMSEYGHRLNFDENGLAECPESGQKYRLVDSGHALSVQIEDNK
jgi:UDP-2-acetamido-3-amino-2,3-dideoxy-glucuronate N-acetyltransferase